MTYQQIEIGGTQMPILASIDPGMLGAIVINDAQGNITCHKMPQDSQGGIDLLAIRKLLVGSDMVLIEKESSGGFQGHTRVSDNSVFAQYKELYGLMVGADIPFHAIRPQAWQKFLGFPKKKEVEAEDGIWKDFLLQQAQQRFPSVKKIHKYAGDAFLIYDVARKLWPMERSLWP